MSGGRIENAVQNCGRHDLGGNRTQQTQLNLCLQRTCCQSKQAVAVIE